MNNSRLIVEGQPLAEEPKVDTSGLLQEEESKVVRLITALQTIQQTAEWSTLKELKLDGLVKSLKSKLYTEAKKDQPDALKLRHITGQLEWAEKYADLLKWEGELRVELRRIRTMLHGKPEN